MHVIVVVSGIYGAYEHSMCTYMLVVTKQQSCIKY